jgi:diguanylate cyclase (GGDEF)-like protein/PAS domain S-box-containing protein
MVTMYSSNEEKRLKAVNSTQILDTANESDFDDLVNIAAMIFEVPISTVTILDSHRQWFKAAVGLSIQESPRDESFCTHAIQQHEPLIITDASKDPRFSESPLVLDEPHLAFYAGVPLLTSDNLAIGTFCIMDRVPRVLSDQEIEILKILANQAMKLLELRTERNKYQQLVLEKEIINLQLNENKQRWQFALEGAGDGVWDWDVLQNNSFLSKRWKEMLGYDDDELPSSYETWRSLIHKDDRKKVENRLNNYLSKKIDDYKVEYRMLCKDQTYKWILARGKIVEWDADGGPKRVVGTHTDISDRKKAEEIIWQQANFDALTGLPNRRMFFDRLKEEVKRAARAKRNFALMFIDLDGFKEVNDSFGHKAGDNVLIQVTQRVKNCIRDSDTFARLAGDEFTIILRDIEHLDAVNDVAKKLLNAINLPYHLGARITSLSASVGISIYPMHSASGDELITIADKAMYEAKANGKNCCVITTFNKSSDFQ